MDSSGGFSLYSLTSSLERISSFAESDSAFSTATEAESDMTEGGEEEVSITPRQTYFMCYATDLLGAFEQIRKRSLAGVRAIEDVSLTGSNHSVEADSQSGSQAGSQPANPWVSQTVIRI